MHPEALTEEAKELLPLFKNFSDFYLAGGTALALQLGHRISIDFDFFSTGKIAPDFLSKVERVFGKKLSVSVNNAEELTFLAGSVKITFLHYPFPLLFSLLDFQSLRLAAGREIAAMKAYTIGRRGNFKDYVDLYFVLAEKVDTLENIIQNAERKYGEVFNARLFLEQLVYLEDVEDTEILFLKGRAEREKLKKFFEKKIKEIKL